jgi:hypothetical protein
MGSGTSRNSLTREECKQLVPEGRWDNSWDEFYFADGKSVSSEIAECVWAKSERWTAQFASTPAVAESVDSDSTQTEDTPVERVAGTRGASIISPESASSRRRGTGAA